MASRDNPRKVEEVDVQYMPISSTGTAKIGDLMFFDTSAHLVSPMTAVAQSTAFVGVAGSTFPGSTTDGNIRNNVKVYKRGVFEFDLTNSTTAYFQNDEFRWNGSAGTANKVELSTSNQIGRVWVQNTVGDTVVRLRIDGYVKW